MEYAGARENDLTVRGEHLDGVRHHALRTQLLHDDVHLRPLRELHRTACRRQGDLSYWHQKGKLCAGGVPKGERTDSRPTMVGARVFAFASAERVFRAGLGSLYLSCSCSCGQVLILVSHERGYTILVNRVVPP
jgi:hypothetical protein